MSQSPIVIAISAISGGGKSTIVRQLTEQLSGAVALFFDDYATAETYPNDFEAWAATGYDLNELKSPLLAQHLAAIKAGESFTSPVDGQLVQPADIVVFEAPLGRVHKATAPFIDYLAFIDTPLELGLARMVLRATTLPSEHGKSADELAGQIQHISGVVESYVEFTRPAYKAQREQVIPGCDLVVDGSGSVEAVTKAILDGIHGSGLLN